MTGDERSDIDERIEAKPRERRSSDTPEQEASKQSGTRSIDIRVEIDAPSEVVWQALTDADQIASWFAERARVEPGAGGSIGVSWAGAAEYASRIEVWDPPYHLRLIDQDADPATGRRVPIAQDYHIEGRAGITVLRLVHSGFSTDAKWDEMFDTMSSGWRYFLFNLKHYVELHRGIARAMVFTRRRVLSRTRDELWPQLLGAFGIDASVREGDAFSLSLGDDVSHGIVAQWKPPIHFAGTLADLNDGLVFLELESSGTDWHAGFWISTYGIEPERVARLQAELDLAVDALLPAASTPH